MFPQRCKPKVTQYIDRVASQHIYITIEQLFSVLEPLPNKKVTQRGGLIRHRKSLRLGPASCYDAACIAIAVMWRRRHGLVRGILCKTGSVPSQNEAVRKAPKCHVAAALVAPCLTADDRASRTSGSRYQSDNPVGAVLLSQPVPMPCNARHLARIPRMIGRTAFQRGNAATDTHLPPAIRASLRSLSVARHGQALITDGQGLGVFALPQVPAVAHTYIF